MWSNVINCDQMWSKCDQMWSNVIKCHQMWSNVVKCDQYINNIYCLRICFNMDVPCPCAMLDPHRVTCHEMFEVSRASEEHQQSVADAGKPGESLGKVLPLRNTLRSACSTCTASPMVQKGLVLVLSYLQRIWQLTIAGSQSKSKLGKSKSKSIQIYFQEFSLWPTEAMVIVSQILR